MPRYARSARFDYESNRVFCTQDTRVETLDTIYRWFNDAILDTGETLSIDGNSQGRVFWLDGVAGTGKSTIAQTVANYFHSTHNLGASLFCSRDNADCSNVGLIFPTIADQLSLFNSSFQKHLSDAMVKDPDVQYTLPSMQLEKLVINPLRAAIHEEAFPPCLVIIDALDECKDKNATSTILLSLSAFAGRLAPLKCFITSRPVTKVVQGFRNTDLMKDTGALVLHSIPSNITEKDIRIYLEKRLSCIAQSFALESWPSSEALAELVQLSSGLFIFAATAANFIEDQNASNPEEQLKFVLSTVYIGSAETSPHRHLDALYLAVLHETFPQISEQQRIRLGVVLGTIALLFNPLDPESLEQLLGLDKRTVRSTLRHLHSIVIVPTPTG